MKKNFFLSGKIKILLLYALLSSPLSAQHGDIRFERISKAEEISEATILCIYQDSRGFLWFGTENGLNRYDGTGMKIFYHSPEDPTSLSEGNIQAIIEDNSFNLWIGTYGGGLNKFNMQTETFTHYRHNPDEPTSLSDNEVLSIIIDRLSNLWIGTYGGGLNKLETNNKSDSLLAFIHYKPIPNNPSSLGGIEINSIYEDKNGIIWIGTNNGLSKYVRDNDNFINYYHDPANPKSLSGGEVNTFYEDQEGNLWIGTNGAGLNKVLYSDMGKTPLPFVHYKNIPDDATSISDNHIRSIYEDSRSVLWIGTVSGGLNIFNKENQHFNCYKNNKNDPTSLGSNYISSIYEDNTGIIWIGTHLGGTPYKFDRIKEQFNPYRYYLPKPSNFSIQNVFQIYEDRFGILWFATYGGLCKCDREKKLWIIYTHDPDNPFSISSNNVTSICEDPSGILWIGTVGGGINKFDRKNEKFIDYKHNPNNSESLSHNIVLSIDKDNSGTLWIGTWGGLNKLNSEKGKFISYIHDPNDPRSLSDNRVRYIYEDRSDNFWVGTTSGGLNKFDKEKGLFTHYKHHSNDFNSINSNGIYFIYEDNSSGLWIGTGKGINKFDREKETFKSYKLKDGLPGEIIYGLLEDKRGNFWISSVNGLIKFNPVTEKFRNYDMRDGLQTNEFNERSYFKTKSGEMIYGGINGLSIFHPDSLVDNTHIPPVFLTDFKLFNEPVPVGFDKKRERKILSKSITETSRLELTYEDKIFSFEFATLDFHSPSKNQYAYIMEGFEENWNYTDASQHFVTYTNLDPGEYIFRVKGSNNHGVWNEKGTSLRIIILPPWWATTWAYLIYALIGLGLIYFMWTLQLKRVRNKHELELTKFEAEKMYEVDELKSRFFANISHEFRTPLTLILGLAKKTVEKSKDQTSREDAGVIRRNAKRLHELVNQLLDLSKLESGKMTLKASPLNIIPILKGLVLSFASFAERKRITLKFNSDENELIAYLDKDKIEKIVTNLLSNAFKFTPQGGRIEFTIKKTDGNVEIVISDTGIGISPERIEKIFDRFYQVDSSHTREQEGTGLGLALTKELVELHKGHIRVESSEGKGSTFTVTIPMGKDHLKPEEIISEKLEEEEAVSEAVDLDYEFEVKKIKSDIAEISEEEKLLLLIVEDNVDVRNYIKEDLKNEYTILEAVNGEEGLNQAIKHIPDLIISDVMMPKMDGFEMCKKLKSDERTSHIPIILLTAKATDKDKILGYETGADEYVMKPFDNVVLKSRIKNLIRQRERLKEHFIKEGIFEFDDTNARAIDKIFLKKAIDIINNHISDETFSVDLFADEIAMSKSQLRRKLVALVGESPGDLIRNIRLRKAAKLLEQNFGNVSEIAAEVGFNNPSNFAQVFKKHFGVSPTEYLNSKKI